MPIIFVALLNDITYKGENVDLREIDDILAKLQKVGTATCESCNLQTKFNEIEMFNGSYLCPDCLRKIAWRTDNVVELPS